LTSLPSHGQRARQRTPSKTAEKAALGGSDGRCCGGGRTRVPGAASGLLCAEQGRPVYPQVWAEPKKDVPKNPESSAETPPLLCRHRVFDRTRPLERPPARPNARQHTRPRTGGLEQGPVSEPVPDGPLPLSRSLARQRGGLPGLFQGLARATVLCDCPLRLPRERGAVEKTVERTVRRDRLRINRQSDIHTPGPSELPYGTAQRDRRDGPFAEAGFAL